MLILRISAKGRLQWSAPFVPLSKYYRWTLVGSFGSYGRSRRILSSVLLPSRKALKELANWRVGWNKLRRCCCVIGQAVIHCTLS